MRCFRRVPSPQTTRAVLRVRLFSAFASTVAEPFFAVVDPHFHFFEPDGIQPLLKRLHGVEAPYLPRHHAADFEAVGRLRVEAAVHIEALPEDAEAEVHFVRALASLPQSPPVRGIVASCDLSTADGAPDRDTSGGAELVQRLARLEAAGGGLVRGVRWICNYAGEVGVGEAPIESRATWPRVARDYSADPAFEEGLRTLAARGLSFDLQTNPAQLEAWAEVLGRVPGLKVVVDHMGHPRHLGREGRQAADAAELATWRRGMRALAALPSPRVHVKLSMVGYAVPGWWRQEEEEYQGREERRGGGGGGGGREERRGGGGGGGAGSAACGREALARSLVLELIGLFGSDRCMFASNWPVDGEGGLTLDLLYGKYREWVRHLEPSQQDDLFRGTAIRFYRLKA